MKKKLLYFFFVLSYCTSLYCLYMGNPASVEILSEGLWMSKESVLSVGLNYQADVLLDKSLKPTNSTIKQVNRMNYTMQQGGLNISFLDRFEVFGLLGAQKFDFDILVSPTLKQEIQTSNDLAWTLGFKALVYEEGPFVFGLDLEYETAHPNISQIIQNGVPFKSPQGSKFRYQEWQFSLAISYKTEFITPYIGYCYSHPIINFKNFSPNFLPKHKRHFTVKGQKKSGGAVGATLSNGKFFSVTFEARFIDEAAFTATGSLKF